MTTFVDAADFYVSLGWSVFPLKAGAKIPAVKGGRGFKDATTDAKQIDIWARQYPGCNIGIVTGATSGIVVIDIDPRNGGDAAVAKLAREGRNFTTCPEVRTGNGGRHLFYALSAPIKSSKDRLGRGIDVKSDGGYVVAAPSRITPEVAGATGEYRWLLAPGPSGCPPLPRWLAHALAPKQPTRPKFERQVSSGGALHSLERVAAFVAAAPAGERNNRLYWAVRTALRAGAPAGTVYARLVAASQSCGLPLPEVTATFNSGLKAEASHE